MKKQFTTRQLHEDPIKSAKLEAMVYFRTKRVLPLDSKVKVLKIAREMGYKDEFNWDL